MKNRFSTLCKKRAKLEASLKENNGVNTSTNNKRLMVHKDHNIGVESSASSKQDGYARIVLQLILNCDFNISEDMGCFFF